MGGIFSPKPPSQAAPVAVAEPVIEPLLEETNVDERDIDSIDRMRRRRPQSSLLELLSTGGSSPTIL